MFFISIYSRFYIIKALLVIITLLETLINCHIERSKISNIESKRDISCLRTRTSKALAHTCKYDKSLESSFAKKEIAKLDNICFGDFALLARSANFTPLTSSQQLLEKLQEESRLKDTHTNTRKMGF